MPFRRGEKADGAVHPASQIFCCRQCCQGYGYLQDWHLAPQSALPRMSQISRYWIFSQSGPGPPARQISQNLLSNPVVSQSRTCSLGVNGVLGTPMDGAGYPWGNSLAISCLGRIWIETQRVRSEIRQCYFILIVILCVIIREFSQGKYFQWWFIWLWIWTIFDENQNENYLNDTH